MTIGQKIRELRRSKNLSGEEVANLCNFSSKQVLYTYEKDRNKPSVYNLSLIAKALDVPITYFIPESEQTENKTPFDKTIELLEAQLNKANEERERLLQIIERILKIQTPPNFLDAPEEMSPLPFLGGGFRGDSSNMIAA